MKNPGLLSKEVEAVLEKARAGNGLSPSEAGSLFDQSHFLDWPEIFKMARKLTEENFHRDLRFFVPLYFSNYCVNDCLYCGFREGNPSQKRRFLTDEEFLQEARFLWSQGHRTLLLIASEHPHHAGVERITRYADCLRQDGLDFFLMAEVAPMKSEEYRSLREHGVRQCLLFQETYQRSIYDRLHRGPKREFAWRYGAMARALEGGIDKVGLGILLGLAPFAQDVVELIRHAWGIREKYGCWPATISFPRFRSARGVSFFENPVGDADFEKILAIVRLALPSVGIVLTTREDENYRRRLLELGIAVTHLSAGSSTVPGGYTLEQGIRDGQFEVIDRRPLHQITEEVVRLGYEPILDTWNPHEPEIARQ